MATSISNADNALNELSLLEKFNLISQIKWGRRGSTEFGEERLSPMLIAGTRRAVFISMIDLHSIAYQFSIERTPANLTILYLILSCRPGDKSPREIIEKFRLSKDPNVVPYPARFIAAYVRIKTLMQTGSERELSDLEMTEIQQFGQLCASLLKWSNHRNMASWLLKLGTDTLSIQNWLTPMIYRWELNAGRKNSIPSEAVKADG